MSLSIEEQETLVNYDYCDKIVHIFTTQEKVKRRLINRIGSRHGVIFGGSEGAWTIDVPMAYCRKPDQVLMPENIRPPVTDAQRQAAGERLASYRRKKAGEQLADIQRCA